MRQKKQFYLTMPLLCTLLLFMICFASCGKKTEAAKETERTESEAKPEAEPLEKWQEGTIYHNGKSYRYNSSIKTYLFLGIDKDEPVKTVPDGIDGGQADALFLLVADRDKEKLSLVKIHRNTMTEIEVYKDDGTDLGSMKLQLCLQHGYGDGARLSCLRTVNAVENLFYHIPITGYFSLNMGGIRQLNDAAGGVTVEVLEDVEMPGIGVKLHEGEVVTLTGNEAYAYVRKRDVEEFDSATGRLERQTQYLMKLIPQLRSLGKSKGNAILEELDAYVVTDIIYLDLLEETAGYGFSENNVYTVPGTTAKNGEFEEYHVDEDTFYEMILEIFYDEVE